MIEEKEIDKEMPDGRDELICFDGGLYEFDTSAGWTDKWPQLTKQELLSRNSLLSIKKALSPDNKKYNS